MASFFSKTPNEIIGIQQGLQNQIQLIEQELGYQTEQQESYKEELKNKNDKREKLEIKSRALQEQLDLCLDNYMQKNLTIEQLNMEYQEMKEEVQQSVIQMAKGNLEMKLHETLKKDLKKKIEDIQNNNKELKNNMNLNNQQSEVVVYANTQLLEMDLIEKQQELIENKLKEQQIIYEQKSLLSIFEQEQEKSYQLEKQIDEIRYKQYQQDIKKFNNIDIYRNNLFCEYLEEESKSLKNDLQNLNKLNKTSKNKIQKTETKLNELETRLDKVQDEQTQLKTNIMEIQINVVIATQNKDVMQIKSQSLKNKLENIQKQQIQSSQVMNQIKQQIYKQQENLKTFETQMQKNRNLYNQEEKNLQVNLQQVKKLAEDLNKIMDEQVDLFNSIKELQPRYDNAQTQHDSKMKQYKTLYNINSQLKGVLKK